MKKLTSVRNYLIQKMDLEMPSGNIPGSWFSENGLLMIVRCTCCDMTMALPSAFVDYDTGEIFCYGCAGGDYED